MGKSRAMKVTTVRFGEDLWGVVAAEAERAGVSTSQFIREAALLRAAAAGSARGETLFDWLTRSHDRDIAPDSISSARREVQRAVAALNRAVATDVRQDGAALHAENQQAMRVAADRHEKARATRRPT